MVLLLALGLIIFALMFPETSTGQWMKRHFVDAPAQWFANLTLRRAFFACVGGMTVLAVFALLPSELALLAAGDVMAYAEIAAALALVASQLQLRRFLRSLKVTGIRIYRRLKRWGIVMRSRQKLARWRGRRIHGRKSDDPHPAFA